MKSNLQKHAERLPHLRRLRPILCALFAGFSAAGGLAADFPGSFGAGNMEISVYPQNSVEPDAVWKINSVSPGHRRLGFFRVKLLPVLVVEGIQLEFTKTHPQTNWLEGFRCDWAPGANPGIFEWRDFRIFFPQEKVPRLQAKRVYPVAHAGTLICRLDGVTLQAGFQPIHLARAEVRAEGPAGNIVWRDAAAIIRWDLFSGQFATNAITQGTQNENP